MNNDMTNDGNFFCILIFCVFLLFAIMIISILAHEYSHHPQGVIVEKSSESFNNTK